MRFTKSKKKCVKKSRQIKNKKRLRSKKIRQSGGGALNSIMSMIPFMPKGQAPQANTTNYSNNQVMEQQNSQNVLVGALCNQFVKNNIKGNNTSTYDGVLDNLCSNQQVGLPSRINTVYSSNSMNQNNVAYTEMPQNTVAPQSNNNTVSTTNQEGGDFEMPSFLSGVKGFAKMYSAPLRMGINAIKGLATGKKKSATASKEPSLKKFKSSKKLRYKKKKRSKKKHKYRKETLDEEIARAERENEEERKANKAKIVEQIKAGLENNIDLESSEVLKKK